MRLNGIQQFKRCPLRCSRSKQNFVRTLPRYHTATRWRWLKLQKTACLQSHQHASHLTHRLLLRHRIQQSLTNRILHRLHRARTANQPRQQPPRKSTATGQPPRRSIPQRQKLTLRPVLHTLTTLRHLLLQILLRPNQHRILRILRNLIILLLPLVQPHIILMGHRKHVPPIVILRTTSPTKHLMR